jgi:subtilisin family serine protease
MKRMLLAVLPALVLATPSHASAPQTPYPISTPAFDGRVSVRLAPGEAASLRGASLRGLARMRTASAVLRSLDAAYEVRTAAPSIDEGNLFAEARAFGLDRWFQVQVDPTAGYEAVAAWLRAQPGVEYVEPGLVSYVVDVVPNDPSFSRNWGHGNTGTFPSHNGSSHSGPNVGTVGFDTNVQGGWGAPSGYGSASVIIGIVDSGVDPTHPDLSQVAGYDYVYNDAAPSDSFGHGTACAGVAAGIANNGFGVAGAAGGCKIMPLRAYVGASGTIPDANFANGILYAASHGAHVVSMSFSLLDWSKEISDALNAADAAGVVLIASTGNANKTTISFPARHPKVIAVGAANPCGGRKRSSSNAGQVNMGVSTDSLGVSCDNEVWWGSSYGVATKDDSAAVDVVAPTELVTTDIQGALGLSSDGYVDWFNGTSCAAPYAAGVAALIKSQHPSWTSAQVRQRLVATAIDLSDAQTPAGWDKYTGYGLVNAGLPDVAPTGFAGWYAPVVPRPAADATIGSVPLPPTLNGEVDSYVSVGIANSGEAPTGLGFLGIAVDDVLIGGGVAYDIPAGAGGYLLNIPITIHGGRHVVGEVADQYDDLVESNEANNRNAHQWAFIGAPMSTSTSAVVARAAPPGRTAGRADVPVAETTYDNVDAVRMVGPAPSTAFWVMGLHGSDDVTDLDLLIHLPTSSPTENFTPAYQMIASQLGVGKTDFVVLNREKDPHIQLDAASLLFAGTGGSRFESRISGAAMTFSGTTLTIVGSLGADMMVDVKDLTVLAGGVGSISIELDSPTPVHFAIYDTTLTYSNRQLALQHSAQIGLVHGMTRTFGQGRTALVLYRDRTEGTGPVSYTLTVRRPGPELVASNAGGVLFAPSGVYKDGVGNAASAPTALDGNANTTRFYYGYTNNGPQAASGFMARELLDGAEVLTWTPGPLAGGASASWISGLRTVRGGRHTIGFTNDVTSVIDEFNETDNDHASQWVWSPLSLPMNTVVTRGPPPLRSGGWAQIPGIGPTYDNVDGLRTSFLQPIGDDGYWNYFALASRSATDNVDLVAYQPISTGPSNGFAVPSATSSLPAGRVDFLGFDAVSPRQVDLGILRAGAATDSVVIYGARSNFLDLESGTFGPFTIEAGKLIAVFDYPASGASRQVRLNNLSGNANLDLHVLPHVGDGSQVRLPTDGQTAQANGDGMDEVLQVALTGFPAIVVNKRGTSDIAKTATFSVQISNSTVDAEDAGLPARVALAPVRPNPVTTNASIAFDLPRAGPVRLEAYDVAGRRVATLATGDWTAGRHAVDWDARHMASGVYLVRLEAGGVETVTRMVVTR